MATLHSSKTMVVQGLRVRHRLSRALAAMGRWYLLLAFCALVCTGTLVSPRFLMKVNILNVLLQNSMMAIIAMGMLLTIITGGIDLSVGSVVALSGCLVAGFVMSGMNSFAAIVAVIALVSLAGLASGLLVSYGKVAPFIATLAMMTIVRGAAYIYQVGSDRRIDDTGFVNMIAGKVWGLPIPVILMVAVVLIVAFVLAKTTFGRAVYAIGGNKEASRLAGINVPKHLTLVYVVSSALSGLAGMILAGRLRLGTALVGQGYELDAIAAVVVGGASLSGGTGTALNTLIGAFIIGIMNNILNLMGVPAYPQMIIKGIIILGAVLARREG